jgi:hypothetical protein
MLPRLLYQILILIIPYDLIIHLPILLIVQYRLGKEERPVRLQLVHFAIVHNDFDEVREALQIDDLVVFEGGDDFLGFAGEEHQLVVFEAQPDVAAREVEAGLLLELLFGVVADLHDCEGDSVEWLGFYLVDDCHSDERVHAGHVVLHLFKRHGAELLLKDLLPLQIGTPNILQLPINNLIALRYITHPLLIRKLTIDIGRQEPLRRQQHIPLGILQTVQQQIQRRQHQIRPIRQPIPHLPHLRQQLTRHQLQPHLIILILPILQLRMYIDELFESDSCLEEELADLAVYGFDEFVVVQDSDVLVVLQKTAVVFVVHEGELFGDLDEEVLDALVFLYGEVYYVVLEAVGVDVDGDEEEVDGGVFAGGEGGGLGVAGEVAQEHLVYL